MAHAPGTDLGSAPLPVWDGAVVAKLLSLGFVCLVGRVTYPSRLCHGCAPMVALPPCPGLRCAAVPSNRRLSTLGRCTWPSGAGAVAHADTHDGRRDGGGATLACPGLAARRPGHRHLPRGCVWPGKALVARA